MDRKRHTDSIIGIGLLVFSFVMYFFLIPHQIKEISYGAGSLSPSIFPKVATGIIGFLSIFLVINNAVFKKQTSLGKFGPNALRIILFLIAYVIGIEILGYLAATGIFLFGLMFFLSRENWKRYILIVLVFLAVNYFFFEKVLKLILPRGYFFH